MVRYILINSQKTVCSAAGDTRKAIKKEQTQVGCKPNCPVSRSSKYVLYFLATERDNVYIF